MSAATACLLCFISSFFVCFVSLLWLIPRLRAMKMGQKILEIGPVWHASKEGTPTMGGIVFLISALLSGGVCFLFFLPAEEKSSRFALVATLLFCIANGAVGILDDATKLRHARNEGLTPTQKLILQSTLAGAYLFLLRGQNLISDTLYIPLLGELRLGILSYFLLLVYVVGIVNCANLTDGVDGLAAGVGSVIFAFMMFFSLESSFKAPSFLSALFLGCTLSFLFFNRHPARIFMGDTGSLFIGSAAASIPILLKSPLLGIIFGIIYVLEGCSVILQVLFYKKTKRRLFLMAPIHHHFERCGWSENKIVLIFSCITAIACTLGVFLG